MTLTHRFTSIGLSIGGYADYEVLNEHAGFLVDHWVASSSNIFISRKNFRMDNNWILFLRYPTEFTSGIYILLANDGTKPKQERIVIRN